MPVLAICAALAWSRAQTPQANPHVKPPAQTPAAQASPAQASPAQAPGATEQLSGKPPVSGVTPSITDAAELSAPGWIEFDPGVLKDLVGDPNVGTPVTFKYTTKNNRLQYLLASDGVVTQGSTTGVGDTYLGVHYLFKTQDKGGYDIALKGIGKIPTAPSSIGGTGKYDQSAFLLVSRDMTKWGLHEDMNAGISAIGNSPQTGYTGQALLAYSTTTPLRGGRWQYTNELVYLSALPDQEARLTTMHGFAYAAHTYEVYSAALQVRLDGDIPRFQILLAASFNVAKL